MAAEAAHRPRRRWFSGLRPGSWFLAALLILLAVRTVALDRKDWPGFVGDEATYLMAAESLAWDGDFIFERGDYERFRAHWGDRPEMLLFLQSGDQGRTLVYGKPFFYPILIAPLTRVWPTHGALLTNILLLALAAALASRALAPFLDDEAPLWVATFLFASVAFAYTVWAHSDSFLMSLIVIALSLALLGRDGEWRRTRALRNPWLNAETGRWLLIGLLAATVIFSRPFYIPLVIPLVLLLPHRRRRQAAVAFGLAVVVVVGTAAASRWALAGTVTSYTGERGGFYAGVGLPEVDFPGESWEQALRRTGSVSWQEARRPLEQETEAGLWLWNPVYFLVGEHVGLLPYFLPLVLVLFGIRLDRVRWGLILAVGASITAFFLYRPFNFFGGGAAIGNRYFLPLYPALWFLVARRPSVRVRRWAPVLVLLAAGVFLWPLWLGLGDYPLTREQTYRFVSSATRALLPYETTQSHLKPGGQEDVIHQGIWVRVLSPGVRADESRIWVRRENWAELLIASPTALGELEIVAPAGTESTLEVTTGEIIGREPGNGVAIYRLRMPRPRARHAMWWTWKPLNLYRLRLRFRGEADETIVGFYLKVAEGDSRRPGRQGGQGGPPEAE